MSKVITFLKEVRVELGKVSWPTTSQIINYTLVVIALSLFLAIYLGALDFLFTWILQKFVL